MHAENQVKHLTLINQHLLLIFSIQSHGDIQSKHESNTGISRGSHAAAAVQELKKGLKRHDSTGKFSGPTLSLKIPMLSFVFVRFDCFFLCTF